MDMTFFLPSEYANNFTRVNQCVCCSGCNLYTTRVRKFIFTVQLHADISRSSLSIKVIGSRSRSNKEMTYFNKPLIQYTFMPLHLHIRSGSSEGQGQIKENQFSVYCKCFCGLSVIYTRMVHLRQKGVLVQF